MDTGAETNVPLLVASVFAATFLVVGAIAYLILFRQSASRAQESVPHTSAPNADAPPEMRAVEADSEPTPQFVLPLDDAAPEPTQTPMWESVVVRAEPSAPAPADASRPDGGQRLVVRLYRALMFATGIVGLLASALMFSAVDGLTLLPVIALLVAAFSLYSIYRGFVPDRELTARDRR